MLLPSPQATQTTSSSYQNGSPYPLSLPAAGHFPWTISLDIYAGQLRQVVRFYSAPAAQLPTAIDTPIIASDSRRRDVNALPGRSGCPLIVEPRNFPAWGRDDGSLG